MNRANLSSSVLAYSFALALVTPLAVSTAEAQYRPQPQAQPDRAVPRNSPAYNEGYERGTRAGGDDGQRNREFNYEAKPDYRNGDAGYRRDYGDRDRWRIDFRLGFEFGYRSGYERYRPSYGRNGGYDRNDGWRPGAGGPPPWANGRGRGGHQYNDYAFQNGFTDGYDAGLADGRSRRRFDPIGEGRYRSGDHGYHGSYGSREAYKYRYRDAFREGYEQGYEDGRRYDSRSNRWDGKPWWWPW
jgi:hypothetical protein